VTAALGVTYSYTFELRDKKVPYGYGYHAPEAELPKIGEETFAGLTVLADQILKDTGDTGNPNPENAAPITPQHFRLSIFMLILIKVTAFDFKKNKKVISWITFIYCAQQRHHSGDMIIYSHIYIIIYRHE
jgi:hypothetical protein